MGDTRIRITVGDRTIEARLHDNPTARSLIDQLPLTLDFSDYGGQEVLAEPPSPLTMEGAPAGESAPAAPAATAAARLSREPRRATSAAPRACPCL